jgi:hypothetical protein
VKDLRTIRRCILWGSPQCEKREGCDFDSRPFVCGGSRSGLVMLMKVAWGEFRGAERGLLCQDFTRQVQHDAIGILTFKYVST